MSAAFPGILDQLADLLERATIAAEVLGRDTEGQYRRLAKLCHPDLFPPGPEQDKATKVFRRLTELRDAAMQAATPQVVPSPTRQYELVKQLAAGDLADVTSPSLMVSVTWSKSRGRLVGTR